MNSRRFIWAWPSPTTSPWRVTVSALSITRRASYSLLRV